MHHHDVTHIKGTAETTCPTSTRTLGIALLPTEGVPSLVVAPYVDGRGLLRKLAAVQTLMWTSHVGICRLPEAGFLGIAIGSW